MIIREQQGFDFYYISIYFKVEFIRKIVKIGIKFIEKRENKLSLFEGNVLDINIDVKSKSEYQIYFVKIIMNKFFVRSSKLGQIFFKMLGFLRYNRRDNKKLVRVMRKQYIYV